MTGLLAGVFRRQPPAAFSFVMATGIVALALEDVGLSVFSRLLLGVSAAALVVLLAGLAWRLATDYGGLRRDALDPRATFGFFTLVAALNVVGAGFSATAPVVTWVLAAASVPLWLAFTYGIPAIVMLRPGGSAKGTAAQADGSWFLWVVATQSVSVAAATLARGLLDGAGPGGGMAQALLVNAAVGLWGIGVLLYLMLTTLVTLRLLAGTGPRDGIVPSNWIYMGATAITVLAGSHILGLPADDPLLRLTVPVVGGLSYMLWAFGMWWVPLLVIFGFWRHVVRRERLVYGTGLWSIVFPLGMYSVASFHFGRIAGVPLLGEIGRWASWLAVAVWLAVTALMVVTAATGLRNARVGSRPAP
ncbi:tellurite resistance/C4-dicarboxylate transporter family protein [Specibacter sp. RAF43]|uniref:tellurite resistance/C4-dicarboxylate transporter family protein n=1 Tax=Specibacter sp. RAF43 TaxID=3233057 RepID=UPI003F96BBFF